MLLVAGSVGDLRLGNNEAIDELRTLSAIPCPFRTENDGSAVRGFTPLNCGNAIVVTLYRAKSKRE